MNNLFLSYLIMKATEKSNVDLKKNRKNRKKQKSKKIKREDDTQSDNESIVSDDNSDNESIVINHSTISKLKKHKIIIEEIDISDDESTNESCDESCDESCEGSVNESCEETCEESSDEEYSFEYDSLDEEYDELLEKHSSANTEEHDMEYFHNLEKSRRESLIQQTQEIYKINDRKIESAEF